MKLNTITKCIAAVLVLSGPAIAVAQERPLSASEQEAVSQIVAAHTVTLAQFGIENPGLLATNPFYFMKDWRRSTQRTFAFGALKKAELELSILEEKTAELKRLHDILPDNADGIVSALEAYQYTLGLFQDRVKSVSESESSATVEQFTKKAVTSLLLQIRLLDTVEFQDNLNLVGKIEVVKDGIAQFTGQLLLQNDSRIGAEI